MRSQTRSRPVSSRSQASMDLDLRAPRLPLTRYPHQSSVAGNSRGEGAPTTPSPAIAATGWATGRECAGFDRGEQAVESGAWCGAAECGAAVSGQADRPRTTAIPPGQAHGRRASRICGESRRLMVVLHVLGFRPLRQPGCLGICTVPEVLGFASRPRDRFAFIGDPHYVSEGPRVSLDQTGNSAESGAGCRVGAWTSPSRTHRSPTSTPTS